MSTTVVVSVISKCESHLEKSGNGKLLPTGYLALILVGLLPLWGSAVASTLNAGSTEEAFLRFVRRLQQESTGTLEDMIEVLKRTTNPETTRWFDERLSA